ncbi:MAG TPA: Hpt domain-containing protein [Acidobacteriota bacterium]|nr:Hpt domain-containing protein [Acidobacteriota bacterium]
MPKKKNHPEVEPLLDELRNEYCSALPERFKRMEELLSKLKHTHNGEDLLEELYTIVHRISGTAGTFGLDKLGNIAGKWEEELDALKGRKLALHSEKFEAMSHHVTRMRKSILF